ncbi:MAG: hypothetical protein ABJL67_13425 [Sulfitobacter sp.]
MKKLVLAGLGLMASTFIATASVVIADVHRLGGGDQSLDEVAGWHFTPDRLLAYGAGPCWNLGYTGALSAEVLIR